MVSFCPRMRGFYSRFAPCVVRHLFRQSVLCSWVSRRGLHLRSSNGVSVCSTRGAEILTGGAGMTALAKSGDGTGPSATAAESIDADMSEGVKRNMTASNVSTTPPGTATIQLFAKRRRSDRQFVGRARRAEEAIAVVAPCRATAISPTRGSHRSVMLRISFGNHRSTVCARSGLEGWNRLIPRDEITCVLVLNGASTALVRNALREADAPVFLALRYRAAHRPACREARVLCP
jgi:hypothetical protein